VKISADNAPDTAIAIVLWRNFIRFPLIACRFLMWFFLLLQNYRLQIVECEFSRP
jgi:hypothetical protein